MSWNDYCMHSNVYNVYTQTVMTVMVRAHMRQWKDPSKLNCSLGGLQPHSGDFQLLLGGIGL